MNIECNGFANYETWCASQWYMDHMADYFANMGYYHADPNELEAALTHVCEERELMSKVPNGFVGDILTQAWREVDWHELAGHLNEILKEKEEENE